MQFLDAGKYPFLGFYFCRQYPVFKDIVPRFVVNVDVVVPEFLPADIAVRSEGRHNIHEVRIQVLCLVGQYDLGMPFRYVIHARKGTAYVFVVPVVQAVVFSYVKNKKMHLVYVVVHFVSPLVICKDSQKAFAHA